jgi:hypothetical protein
MTSPAASYRSSMCGQEAVEGARVDVTDGVGARPHDIALGTAGVAGYGVFADSGGRIGWKASRAFPTSIPGSCVGRALLVELLLVAEQEVASRKASRALGALEGLLFGVRSLVSLQVLQSRKRPCACRADVWPGLVVLGWREGLDRGRRFGLCGRC